MIGKIILSSIDIEVPKTLVSTKSRIIPTDSFMVAGFNIDKRAFSSFIVNKVTIFYSP